MNLKEPRRIWLVTKDGIPQHCAWGLVKTLDEAPIPGKESWAAALEANQSLEDGWDATPTQWRNVPDVLSPDALRHIGGSLSGRDVIVAGLKYNLDVGGRCHSDNKPGHVCEPYEPDATIVDEDALLAAVESYDVKVQADVQAYVDRKVAKAWSGLDPAHMSALEALVRSQQPRVELKFTEKGTLKKVRVSSNPGASIASDEQVLIHRQNGIKKRSE
jgi:hypothetical protein